MQLIPMGFEVPNFTPAIPEIFLLAGACFVLLADLFISDKNRFITYLMAQVVLLITAGLVLTNFGSATVSTFSDMFVLDPMAQVLKVALILVTVGVFVYSRDYLRDRQMYRGEYFTLGLFTVLGMMIMVSAQTLLLIYLGLELLSLAMYALVAFRRDDGRASEAAMKYFVLGAIASGMLLYGMSFIYGITGSLYLDHIATYMSSNPVMQNVGLLLGLSFIIVGLGFKLGAVPFHMWVPDVYDGAPTSVTMFLGTAPKIAAFAMIIRLLAEGLGDMVQGWQQILAILAALSVVLGNIIAIAQTNIKRMFAYSTISHMGFVLMGVLAGTQAGYAASMFYIITYAIISMGGFAVIIYLSHNAKEADQLDDLKGLSSTHPWVAFMMMLFLFAMAGVPPTVGFYAKLSVITVVVDVSYTWLAVLAVVTSVIGAYYYLRAIKLMYFDKSDENTSTETIAENNLDGAKPSVANNNSLDFTVLLSINGFAVLLLGILPGGLMALCLRAIQSSL